MKKKYQIVDNGFNRDNFPDLIGKIVENPPQYASVVLISEKVPMKDIFDKTSLDKKEKKPMEKFVIRCWREGYDKEDIVNGIVEFYKQTPEVARFVFNQIILKLSGIKKKEDD